MIIRMRLLLALVLFFLVQMWGCDDRPADDPQIRFNVHASNLFTVGSKLVATSRYQLCAWDWGNWEKLFLGVPVENPLAVLTKDYGVLCVRGGRDDRRIAIEDNVTNRVLVLVSGKRLVFYDPSDPCEMVDEITLGDDWYCSNVDATTSGEFVGLGFKEDCDARLRRSRPMESGGLYRIGVYDVQNRSMTWMEPFDSRSYGPIVVDLAISEDGRRVAVCGVCNAGWLRVVDVAANRVLCELNPSWSTGFNAVCFAPDGETVYIGGNGGIYLYDAVTGAEKAIWRVNDRCIGVAASPDGRLVAAGTGPAGIVIIFDSATGQRLQTIETDQYTNYGLAFSPDSRSLATSGVMETGIKIWAMPEVR